MPPNPSSSAVAPLNDHCSLPHILQVTFTPLIDGSAAKPQQAMLMLKAAKGPAAYAVAKVKKDGSHTISLTMAAVHKQVGKQVGGGVGGGAALASRHNSSSSSSSEVCGNVTGHQSSSQAAVCLNLV